MSDSAAQVRRVADRLRQRGFTIVEVAGWESRGRGPMTTKARIEHHTATPRSASGDAPTLRVVTNGHGSLQNSLSRWYVSRSGVIYLVALNTSWHAGQGVKGSNSTLSGTEAEHSGTAGEQWSERSLEAQAAISQEECREFGVPVSRVWEHKEHAPSRKVDRAHMSGPQWRHRLETVVTVDPFEEWWMNELTDTQRANLEALASTIGPAKLAQLDGVAEGLQEEGTNGKSFVGQLLTFHRDERPALSGFVDGMRTMGTTPKTLGAALVALVREARARGWHVDPDRFAENRTYTEDDL